MIDSDGLINAYIIVIEATDAFACFGAHPWNVMSTPTPQRGPDRKIDLREAEISDSQRQGQDDPLRELIGVTDRSFRNWRQSCEIVLERIREAQKFVVNRAFYAEISALTEVLEDIQKNCDQDPDDIREEIDLPNHLELIASTLDEYLPLSARALYSKDVHDRVTELEEAISKAAPGLRETLQRMRNNDGKNVLARAKVISRAFRDLEK